MTACGVPAIDVVGMPLGTLTVVWHDTSNREVVKLAKDKDKVPPVSPSKIDLPPPVTSERKDNPAPAPVAPIINPNPTTGDDNMSDADERARKLRALEELLSPSKPALDEDAVLDIVRRRMSETVTQATRGAAEEVRKELGDLLEEARAIVNGAPRKLRIEIAGRVKDMPPAVRHPLFDTLLTLAVCSKEPRALHPMLVGPPAGGKTTAAEQVAQALGLPFFTNGALSGTHELLGYCDGGGKYHTTPFRRAFETGGVYLADEIDGSTDASVPLALNSALANGFMGFPDQPEPVRMHKDFYFIGAANTYGRGADRLFVGRTQLDSATTDRLAMLDWDYDEVLERSLAGDDAWTAYVQAARAACSDLKIRHVISPRATYGGAIYRRTGSMSFDLICNLTVWKGLDREQRDRIVAKMPERVIRRAEAPVITTTTIAAE
jgi:hypothetical protein